MGDPSRSSDWRQSKMVFRRGEAARRFPDTENLDGWGPWYRRFRETGEMEAPQAGAPSRSKLDAHERFSFSGLNRGVRPDVTLSRESGSALAVERERGGLAPSTVWACSSTGAASRSKKVGARLRAAAPRWSCRAA